MRLPAQEESDEEEEEDASSDEEMSGHFVPPKKQLFKIKKRPLEERITFPEKFIKTWKIHRDFVSVCQSPFPLSSCSNSNISNLFNHAQSSSTDNLR
jgi:hypothetical protein